MHSTLNPEPLDPIARYFEQVAVKDEQITLADDAARHPPAAVNNVQVHGDRPSFGRPAVRGVDELIDRLAAALVEVWDQLKLLPQDRSPATEHQRTALIGD
jgi:hypothetical protein